MQKLLVLGSIVGLVVASSLAACSEDHPPASEASPEVDAGTPASGDDGGGAQGDAESDASSGTDTDAAADAGAYVEPECFLRNDTGGPGQYSDTCVQRSWIAAYAGTYASSSCTLTVDVTGSVAATFDVVVSGGDLAGDYLIGWDGAPGPGNDSYYRFTTDATFTTTTTLNFNAGQTVGTSDQRAFGFRVEGIDVGAPVYKGRAFQVVSGKSKDHDCGVMTRR